MPVCSFRELTVWQRAVELSLAIYNLTKGYPREELFGLSSQMRRASVSIASNIAEGQSRITTGEFKQFLGVARGSNAELQTQLVLSRCLNFGSKESIERCESLSLEVAKMLNGLLNSL
jgi:four helix bundle protein